MFTTLGNEGPVLGFDSSGNLIAAGYSTSQVPIFGTLNFTTGAFTSTANASTGVLNDLAVSTYDYNGLGHIVTVPNHGTYYATLSSGTAAVPFGTISASGSTTPIGSGLNFGSGSVNPVAQLLAAPNGTLYAFDTGPGGSGAVGAWGTVNLTSGSFTQIGNLSSVFTTLGNEGPVLGFDSSGDLIASGYSTSQAPIFGTLDLTTGQFTSTANASTGILNDLAVSTYGYNGLGHIVDVPEPSAFVALLGAGAVGLIGYAWRRWRQR